MGHHRLPQGGQRLRSEGRHATGKATQVQRGLTALLVALGRWLQETSRLRAPQTSRARGLASMGRDP
jgi:hypothetical protein